jgi:eukaryotic-like serine/threonine-protein kinase
MEGIVALVMIFGMPVFIVGIREYFKHKRLALERGQQSPEEKKRLEALEKERALLVQRVENLETIVCSVDMELNVRLNRLAAQQSQLALPPPAAPPAVPAPAGAAGEPSSAPTVQIAHRASAGEMPIGALLMERFRVERLLGRGGMGAVYLAVDQRVGETVALKVMAQNLVEDPAAAERFRREVSAARRVTHPNVIRIHDLGEDGPLLFLSMEYFAGKTLAAVLAQRHQLPLVETRTVVEQVARALAAAHTAGVVHRDLKPQNVLCNERWEVRVIDFGLAKASYVRSLTATGLILGTPDYMAPEQVRGQPVDLRTDLYALGAMTYHLLAGRPPFQAESPIAVGFLHCHEPPTPLRRLKPDLPESVEEAVMRCLAKEPAARWGSADEFAARLLSATTS